MSSIGHNSDSLNDHKPTNTNHDNQYGNEATTPTRGNGRYHHSSRSLERKRLPDVPTTGGTTGPGVGIELREHCAHQDNMKDHVGQC